MAPPRVGKIFLSIKPLVIVPIFHKSIKGHSQLPCEFLSLSHGVLNLAVNSFLSAILLLKYLSYDSKGAPFEVYHYTSYV